jgi:hypothetical protein
MRLSRWTAPGPENGAARAGTANGQQLPLADDLRTMLRSGLTTVAPSTPRARTNDVSVMTALPFAL